MASRIVAFFLWPLVWVGQSPVTDDGTIDFESLETIVYQKRLPLGIRACVTQDGMFMFDFSNWQPTSNLYIDANPDASRELNQLSVLNAYLVCLYGALAQRKRTSLDKMVVSLSELLRWEHQEDQWGIRDMRVAALTMGRSPVAYASGIPQEWDWRLMSRVMTLDLDVLDEAYDRLGQLLQHQSPDALLLCDLYLRACKAYEEYNYNLSLVLAWSITEKLLRRLWDTWVAGNQTSLTGNALSTFEAKRKKWEKNDTTKNLSEVLAQEQALSVLIYSSMDAVRNDRNAWLHSLKPVDREGAMAALSVAVQMIEVVEALQLDVIVHVGLHDD